jgi:hypothetical protein
VRSGKVDPKFSNKCLFWNGSRHIYRYALGRVFFYNLVEIDFQWLKLTFKQQNLCIFGISEQFAIRKSTISIYRTTSIFDLYRRIFNLQGLGALVKSKKNGGTTTFFSFLFHGSCIWTGLGDHRDLPPNSLAFMNERCFFVTILSPLH